MDFETKLRSMTVGDFMVTLEDSPRHDFGPYSINRRVCGYLKGAYGSEVSLWDVVVDGPPVWHLTGGCGPKIIDALAKAINIELGAPIVPTAVPTKERRDEGYFWTKERLAEAAQMLAKGGSYREVALHYGKSVDGMKAALKRYGMYKPRFSTQWQSIETAPMDGTLFLVYMGKDNMEIARYDLERNEWWIDAYAPPHIEKNWMEAWMPLPPPPK